MTLKYSIIHSAKTSLVKMRVLENTLTRNRGPNALQPTYLNEHKDAAKQEILFIESAVLATGMNSLVLFLYLPLRQESEEMFHNF